MKGVIIHPSAAQTLCQKINHALLFRSEAEILLLSVARSLQAHEPRRRPRDGEQRQEEKAPFL